MGRYPIWSATTTIPVAAAKKTSAAGPASCGSAKPRVKMDEPASMNTWVMLRPFKGQSTRVNPARKMPSHPIELGYQDRGRLGGEDPVAPFVIADPRDQRAVNGDHHPVGQPSHP